MYSLDFYFLNEYLEMLERSYLENNCTADSLKSKSFSKLICATLIYKIFQIQKGGRYRGLD